ncbi:MAG: DUF4197 family protein [Pseudomonadales bacterium]
MRRLICGLVAVLLLSSCSPGGFTELQRNVTLAAQQQLQRTLASHFTRSLGAGVDTIIAGLSGAGGYLDNPLVRILLPPPLGLVLAVARDLHGGDPEATRLEQLMNHAAQAAIPGAGPVLRAAIASISSGDAELLLQGGTSAATEFVMARTREALLETLGPAVAQTLAQSGANELYAGALRAYELQKSIALAGEEVLRDSLPASPIPDLAHSAPTAPLLAEVPPRDLGEYVTSKAVDGLFAALAQREEIIRRDIQNLASGLLLPAS